jgi:hypothetical protein
MFYADNGGKTGPSEMLELIFQTKGTLKIEAADFSGGIVGTFKPKIP